MTTTEALTTAAHTIHKAGGPKAPWIGDGAWCDLVDDYVYGDLVAEYDADKRHTENRAVRCPPAVEAAVVAFAGEVYAFIAGEVCPRPATICAIEDGKWAMTMMGQEKAIVDSQLAAAEALIVAVAGEVGGE